MTKRSGLMAACLAFCLAFSSFTVAADDVPQVSGEQAAMLDINSADAPTIAAVLDGIGLVKAQEIVAYREMFGSFQSIDELIEVQGIGAATVEKNRHRIEIVKK